MHRLGHEAPALKQKFEAMPPALRRRKLIDAAYAASRQIHGLEPAFLQLLKDAATSGTLPPELASRAREDAESADARYLTLREQGEPEETWMNWFARARLATAVTQLLSDETWQEAAYELCFTQEDTHTAISSLWTWTELTPRGYRGETTDIQ